MTGRELIIYILQNELEDKEIFVDFKSLSIIPAIEYAIKNNVGLATVLTWYSLGFIKGIIIDNQVYIYKDSKPEI